MALKIDRDYGSIWAVQSSGKEIAQVLTHQLGYKNPLVAAVVPPIPFSDQACEVFFSPQSLEPDIRVYRVCMVDVESNKLIPTNRYNVRTTDNPLPYAALDATQRRLGEIVRSSLIRTAKAILIDANS